MVPNDPKSIPAASGSTESSTPQPAAETPVKPRRPFGWLFWTLLVSLIALGVVIAIPRWTTTRVTACKNACVANLKQIDGAVQQWALENKKSGISTVTTSDVLDFLKGSALPLCPENGVYSVTTVSSTPTCSLSGTGHSL